MDNTVRKEDGFGFVEEDTQKDKYLTFSLADEVYAIDICYVTEIIGILKITKVPDMPSFIKGVINLRGKVIPVMDVRARFGLPAREYDERTCVVVVNVVDNAMGLVVDRVNEVMDIPAGQVEPPPASKGSGRGKYVKGIGKVEDEVKILLDVECLVD
ncbi:MAG: chemotaxis protein CheW [Syntrophotalea acetylenica]|jgi:purine-binding chemotaxis protein CheW|uniref:Chemotaxis protein CheW n=1 Tax=Syntrophotalea acetylenica TaxID=29542 RepID=A0A1L3GH96_SYNAC|nr:chemotaxis protein CheW [Syntrophotalea acetylenica]APG25235.1 chemotaxis protein CheW [Syntrophotalea acetylenica]APG43306.1 chemotaxis protein CheW [Syntrophotalea acetylenica]MDD4458002.1 chemotaxis protein CheW [Syntrophotalea acetylenica]